MSFRPDLIREPPDGEQPAPGGGRGMVLAGSLAGEFDAMSSSKGKGDFTDILVKKHIVSKDQLQEAQSMQKQTGAKLADTLVKLGYASAQDVMNAMAGFHGLQFVDLAETEIATAVIELLPASVARQNVT